MTEILPDIRAEFRRQRANAENAMAPLSDDQFSARPGELVNPIALIVKHLAGNLVSRWTDFLTTDGEKPNRDRDGEFTLYDGDTRQKLMADWEQGWSILLATLGGLVEDDLLRTIRIRAEPMSAQVALLRALTHSSYHVGQINYVMRLLRPAAPWLTIAPGQSKQHVASYTKQS